MRTRFFPALVGVLLISVLLFASVVGAQTTPQAPVCPAGTEEVVAFTSEDTNPDAFDIMGESFQVLYSVAAGPETANGTRSFQIAVLGNGTTVTQSATVTTLPTSDGVLQVSDEGPGNFRLRVEDEGVVFAITVCQAPADNQNGGSNGGGGAAGTGDGGDDAADDENDNSSNLSCNQVLQLFRNDQNNQYLDLDSELAQRIQVCLENEVIVGSDTDEPLPDTGGPPLLALVSLGLASAAAGASVLRAGLRREG